MRVKLIDHIMAVVTEQDRRHQEHFAAMATRAEVAEVRVLIRAQDELTNAKFVTYRALIDSQAEKVALALASSDKAVGKAEIATEKRFESVNEFRAQLADQARDLMPRMEAEQLMKALSARIAALEGTGKQGALQMWSYIVGVIGLVGVLVTIYSKL